MKPKIKRTLITTLMVVTYLAGTLWLCLNVSWWFATLYAFPLVFTAILILTVWLEIEGGREDKPDKPN